MSLRLSSLAERLRASLFFVPMVAVLFGVGLGLAGVTLDRRLGSSTATLPFGLTSTVQSARVLLSTVAGATITFAAIAFSVSLLTIQQASSQYSPRVVHTLFRDPFNRRVMGLVVGTFTYCLIVLRSVRSALDAAGSPIIPNLSVAMGVVLGICTILAVVAFINHSAHSMDVSEILESVRVETVALVRRDWSPAEPGHVPAANLDVMAEPSAVVRFDRSGWVQQVDFGTILACIPDGGVMRLDTHPGRYAIEGTPVCAVFPAPSGAELPHVRSVICSAISIGATRTMQQDASYGLRQLVDVALKALSPGVNDPTTAQDAIFHAAAVLLELLVHDPPTRRLVGERGQRLLLVHAHSHYELVQLAFEETRVAAADQPTVCVYLLEALHLLSEGVRARGLEERGAAIAEQARLVVAGCDAADLISADRARVRSAYAHRFGFCIDRRAAVKDDRGRRSMCMDGVGRRRWMVPEGGSRLGLTGRHPA